MQYFALFLPGLQGLDKGQSFSRLHPERHSTSWSRKAILLKEKEPQVIYSAAPSFQGECPWSCWCVWAVWCNSLLVGTSKSNNSITGVWKTTIWENADMLSSEQLPWLGSASICHYKLITDHCFFTTASEHQLLPGRLQCDFRAFLSTLG